MFSKVITLLSLAVISFSSVAQAESIPTLSLGKYELTSGDEEYCSELEVKKSDITDTYLKIGKDRFSLSNKEFKEPSDFDTSCEDHLISTREDNDTSTKLTRIVKEVCKGSIKNSSLKSVIVTAQTITINQKKDQKDLGTCVFTKK
ncbi:hypothetical protein ACLSU7_16815 [Bdellovibrio sp. HCB185ZH]|uniref:hypothetical protein n=1 Tax=Bdellovibrio sp. HCB185ZH TaxID=3394235 RepID=UPI0039A6B862